MNQPAPQEKQPVQAPKGVLFWLSLFIVVVGLMSAIPGVLGLDDGVRSITGLDWVKIRRFPTEWFYPLAFAFMMLCVVLKHSAWKAMHDAPIGKRRLGLLLDLAMAAAAFTVSITYVVEI